MKFLFIIQRNQLRGAENFACQLAKELVVKGIHVDIAYLFEDAKGLHESYPSLRFISLEARYGRRFWDIHALKKLGEFMRQNQYDLVQANASDTLKYAVMSKIYCRWSAPIVFRNASMVSQYIHNPFIKFFNRILYRYTNAIISVAETTKTDLVGLFPELKSKIHVVPIGIDIKDIPIVEKKPFQIIHIGGFTFEKNHKAVLRIFSNVRREVPQATLVLVGDGPLKSSIKNKVTESGLANYVSFTGFVSNPFHYLCQSQVLILPSLIEGLGAVILEAFYCRVPVIAYDVGGIREVLVNNRTGKLIAKGNEPEFGQAVVEMLKFPDYHEDMIENARLIAVKNYSIQELSSRFFEIYQSLLLRVR